MTRKKNQDKPQAANPEVFGTTTGRVSASEPAKSNTPKYMRDKGVEAYNSMPVRFGKVKATVFGGPFKEYVPGQRRIVSVKLAQECPVPSDVTVPTEDFGTPSHPAMHAGIRKALQGILDGNDLYVGCGWGIGRTGLFLSCLAKVMIDFDTRDGATSSMELSPYVGDENGPLKYVRKHYLAGAVETAPQERFIREFDTSAHVAYLTEQLDRPVREVIKEVPGPERIVYTFNPFLALMSMFGTRQ